MSRQSAACLLELGWERSLLPEDGTGSPWSTEWEQVHRPHPGSLCSSAWGKAPLQGVPGDLVGCCLLET